MAQAKERLSERLSELHSLGLAVPWFLRQVVIRWGAALVARAGSRGRWGTRGGPAAAGRLLRALAAPPC